MFRLILFKFNTDIIIAFIQGGEKMPLSKLAQKLRELRKSHNYTQACVANYLGITRQGYSHYEADKRVPDYQALLKLTILYQINIDELINPEYIPVNDVYPLLDPKSYHTGIDESTNSFIYLSSQEAKLITDYRSLTLDKQKFIRQYMEFIKHNS